MPQKGTEKRRSPENVISTDKSALLWMYCRGIVPFETPTFSKTVGELIACATSTQRSPASPIGEANPNIGFASNQNLADPPVPSPQGLEVVAQTASGQLDLVWYDTGRGDPIASDLGIQYASNLLGSFPGWHVVQGGPVNHNDLFPIV